MADVSSLGGMTLDGAGGIDVPSSPDAMLDMMKGMYEEAEKNALKRELMSLIHKLIMDAIKKIGQAA
ncbi:hypothetical protein [Hahella sp. CR1]|uniref:hypothetical protein n=1 Tax=unclassified Hahella TaxID=2624107 RepID=UPI0024411D41|nr:hypothetical protein [Hahella sp. CR1]MDG9668382.1 hypothetical protein [Hahella sp. CR1]